MIPDLSLTYLGSSTDGVVTQYDYTITLSPEGGFQVPALRTEDPDIGVSSAPLPWMTGPLATPLTCTLRVAADATATTSVQITGWKHQAGQWGALIGGMYRRLTSPGAATAATTVTATVHQAITVEADATIRIFPIGQLALLPCNWPFYYDSAAAAGWQYELSDGSIEVHSIVGMPVPVRRAGVEMGAGVLYVNLPINAGAVQGHMAAVGLQAIYLNWCPRVFSSAAPLGFAFGDTDMQAAGLSESTIPRFDVSRYGYYLLRDNGRLGDKDNTYTTLGSLPDVGGVTIIDGPNTLPYFPDAPGQAALQRGGVYHYRGWIA